jgi:hypothetical protein
LAVKYKKQLKDHKCSTDNSSTIDNKELVTLKQELQKIQEERNNLLADKESLNT